VADRHGGPTKFHGVKQHWTTVSNTCLRVLDATQGVHETTSLTQDIYDKIKRYLHNATCGQCGVRLTIDRFKSDGHRIIMATIPTVRPKDNECRSRTEYRSQSIAHSLRRSRRLRPRDIYPELQTSYRPTTMREKRPMSPA